MITKEQIRTELFDEVVVSDEEWIEFYVGETSTTVYADGELDFIYPETTPEQATEIIRVRNLLMEENDG